MDHSQYALELCHLCIDNIMQTFDVLPQQLARAAECMVGSLLNERKILCCGEGQSGALAQIFASNLLNRFNYERPSLPAISLNADATALTAIASDASFHDIFAKQIRALGQAGDVLLVITNGAGSGTTLQAIQAAHDRQMAVVVMCNRSCDDIRSLLTPDDIELSAPSDHRARVAEVQLLAINCLCDMIDQLLFGAAE